MSQNSIREQFEICRKTHNGLDEAGARIDRLAHEHQTMVEAMRNRGYASELQADLERMNRNFQNLVENLKTQLFQDNMKFVHTQATALKDVLESTSRSS